MISIKYQDRWLELSENAKITIEDNSPGFDNNEDRVSITYPFTTSATAWESLTKLGMTALEYDQPRGKFISGFEIYSDGNLIKRGRMRIHTIKKNLNDASQDIVELDFQEYIDVLYDIFKDKKVNELVMDGVRVIEGDEVPPAILGFDGGGGGGGFVYRSTPRFKTSEYAADITLNGDDYICFPSLYFEKALQENTMNGYANWWDDGLQIYPWGQDLTAPGDLYGSVIVYNNHLIPCYYYYKVLEHCFTENSLTLENSSLFNDYFKKAILENNCSILKQHVAISTDGIPQYYAQMTTEINPKNHLPDISIVEFLRDLQKSFNGHFEVNDSIVSFVLNKSNNITDISDNITEDVSLEMNTNYGIQLSYIFDKDDVVLYDYQNRTHPKAIEVESLPLSATAGDIFLVSDTNEIYTYDGTNFNKSGRNVMKYGSNSSNNISPIIPCSDNIIFNYTGDIVTGDVITSYLGCSMDYHLQKQEVYIDKSVGTTYVYGRRERADLVHVENNKFFYKAFYYGIQNTMSFIPYPLGINSNFIPQVGTPSLKQSVGNVSFHFSWHGKYGLTEQFYGDDVKMNDHDKVIFQIEPSYEELYKLKFSNLFFIRNRKYKLVKKSYELPLRDTIVCEMYEITEK